MARGDTRVVHQRAVLPAIAAGGVQTKQRRTLARLLDIEPVRPAEQIEIHVRTWQYYGLWQLEQGNREQAEYHLQKLAQLAGTSSSEYQSLAAALEKPPGTGLVY